MADEQGGSRAPSEGDLRELARSLSAVLRHLHDLAQESAAETLADRLAVHLEVDPRGLPVLSHEFPQYQLVDVQVALDAWVGGSPGRSSSVVGVTGDQRRFHPLSELLSGHHFGVGIGPVEYVDVADSPDSTRSCVRFGFFLLDDGGRRSAVLLRGSDPHGPMRSAMLEIISADPDTGRALMAELRQLAVDRSVLRGQVMALGPGEGHQYGMLRFMHRPEMDRDGLVLPDLTLSRIERHVIGIAAHGRRLEAAGQHLKRGVLLYGPPGTGKTHTIRYLLSRLAGTTAFVLSGQALALIGQACGLARVLQPSLVVLEDIDLIAGDRSFGPIGSNPLLFEVLNQIDGLGDDADVTFLLTTNRVDILERALAERPGRVDAAIEVAPPDEDGRRRLLRLYGRAVGISGLGDADLHDTVVVTEGRTATYLREVVRRAALLAAEDDPQGALRVDGPRLARAATELLGDGDALTRVLLGGTGVPGRPPGDAPGDGPHPGSARPGDAYQPLPGTSLGGQTIFSRGRPGRPDQPRPFAPE